MVTVLSCLCCVWYEFWTVYVSGFCLVRDLFTLPGNMMCFARFERHLPLFPCCLLDWCLSRWCGGDSFIICLIYCLSTFLDDAESMNLARFWVHVWNYPEGNVTYPTCGKGRSSSKVPWYGIIPQHWLKAEVVCFAYQRLLTVIIHQYCQNFTKTTLPNTNMEPNNSWFGKNTSFQGWWVLVSMSVFGSVQQTITRTPIYQPVKCQNGFENNSADNGLVQDCSNLDVPSMKPHPERPMISWHCLKYVQSPKQYWHIGEIVLFTQILSKQINSTRWAPTA